MLAFGARDRADPVAAPLRPDRLACGGTIRAPRKHVLWRDPEEVRTGAALTLLMLVGGIVGGFLIAGTLMNEAVLAFLDIVP